MIEIAALSSSMLLDKVTDESGRHVRCLATKERTKILSVFQTCKTKRSVLESTKQSREAGLFPLKTMRAFLY